MNRFAEFQILLPSDALLYHTARECVPDSERMPPEVDPPRSCILDAEAPRIGLSPEDIDRIDRDGLPKIEHHPLRMTTVGFAGVGVRQVGIALPEGLRIPIDKP